MIVDHIFIFTNDNGKIADELIQIGLLEGSSRKHIGQGTTNRKFYFENFFLEVLWVHDENEILNSKIRNTGLWDRSKFYQNDFSPFGLCIFNNQDSDEVFQDAIKHQPDYFPEGLSIEIISNDKNSNLPWTFRLPFKSENKNDSEPKNHSSGIKKLSKVEFLCKELDNNKFIQKFQNSENIKFSNSNENWLILTFDNGLQKKERIINSLRLTLKY